MKRLVWELDSPSSGFLRKPWLYQIPTLTCCVWWVAEKDEGGGRNEALVFTGVEAYKTTGYHAYSEEMIHTTYDKLVDLGATPMLKEVLGNLTQNENVTGLKHLAISFDEGPLYEFVARDFEYRSSFDVGPVEALIQERLKSCAAHFDDPAIGT